MEIIMYELVLVFITIILYAYQRIAISIWVMAILVMDMSIRYGNKRVYIEIIEDYAFAGCISLQKPWIPKNIEYIAETAFQVSER